MGRTKDDGSPEAYINRYRGPAKSILGSFLEALKEETEAHQHSHLLAALPPDTQAYALRQLTIPGPGGLTPNQAEEAVQTVIHRQLTTTGRRFEHDAPTFYTPAEGGPPQPMPRGVNARRRPQ